MADSLPEKVASRWASIQLKEDPNNWIISGTYQEMEGILKTLKARGFRWDSSRRVWWIPKDKLSERQLANVRKLLDSSQGALAQKVQKRTEELKEAFDRASQLKLNGLRFELGRADLTLTLKGSKTYDVKDEARAAKGNWSSALGWVFDSSTDLPKFESLISRCETLSKVWGKQFEEVQDYLKRPKTWSALGVTMTLREFKVFLSGNTKPIKETIKHLIPRVRFESSWWEVGVLDTNLKQLEALAKDLDEEEGKASSRVEEPKPPREEPKRPNKRPDYCLNCRGWVLPGEGYLVWYYDSEPGDFVWKVQHQDPKKCEEVREADKIRREKARTKAQARKSLRDLATKSEYYVEGRGHNPQGKTVYLNSSTIGYGGGEWVVIEPGEHYMWYVINNGADGDDWSSNNVSTGGAGAIGYRLPYTEEVKVLLEAAKE